MAARVVLACWGSYGDLFPTLGVACALKARGHEAVVASVPVYREFVEGEGIEFRPLRPDVAIDDFDLLRRVMDARRGPEVIFRELLLPAVRDSYEDLLSAAAGADLMVTHPATPAGPVVADKLGLRWASVVLAPLSFFSAYDPPIPPQMPWLGRIARLRPWLGRPLMAMVRRAVQSWGEPVRTLRREIGLSPGRNPVFEGQFSPHLTLALFSPMLAERRPDWPGNVVVTGFVPYNGPAKGLAPEVEEFLAAGEPPVVFTLGSSAVEAAGEFYRESAKAAVRLGIRAILLIGRNPANRFTTPLPRGVLAVESASHAELFPRAAATVHQGGAGTTGQALRSGKPMLVVPHAHDQPDNAERVRRLGVARVLYPRRYDAPRAAAELEKVLSRDGYAARADEIGRVARAEDGAERACDVLKRLLA